MRTSALIHWAIDAEVAAVPFAIEDMKVFRPPLTDSSIVKLFTPAARI